MSVTISPPVRIFALVGILSALGLGAYLLVLGGAGSEPAPLASPPAVTKTTATRPAAPTTPARRATPAKARTTAATRTRSGFPPAIDRALRRHRVVVVAVTTPGAAVDAEVRAEARAGAEQVGAGFVSASALAEGFVRALVARTGVLPQPVVLVLRRPGAVVARLGVVDRETVAQAVAQARR
ncbi:MAG TPA: hypothetical protein VNJ53_10260 [Gaiellaceae bacterium]|nr:hypothetical protein [Gaiellaceae bacterium]